MGGRFVPNPDFARQLFRTEELTELVYSAGDRVLAEAQRLAAAEASSGDFEASLEVDHHRSRSGRPIATVYSLDEGALSIEFGTRTTPRHRILGRALNAARR
jgi:hypothetical protein